MGTRSVVFCFFSESLKLFFEFLELFIGEIFKIDKVISRTFKRADHLVQFEMHGFGVTILSVLNQEYHQEGDNGRGGVDDQLPRVGKMKSGTSEEPDGNNKHSSSKSPGAAENHGGMAGENTKGVADEAKEIAFLVVFL